jgi:long-chain fatty acid transport protein
MRRYTSILIVFITLLFNIQTSYAGGLMLYEIGARNVGLAGSGWAASGFDASTLFTNPAAMSLFNNSQIMLGAQALYGQFGFNPDPRTTVEGNDGGNR